MEVRPVARAPLPRRPRKVSKTPRLMPGRAAPLLSYFGREPVAPERSRLMAKIHGKNSQPELRLRRAVWASGGRFRCHAAKVPGRPDLCNQRARVAVFVDGCFWHGCPKHFRVPATRSAFWVEKVNRNRKRRTQVIGGLAGWKVFEFYECELGENIQGCASRVASALTHGPRDRCA